MHRYWTSFLLQCLGRVGALMLCLGIFAPVGWAQIPLNTTNATIRGKAQPDECFIALGTNFPFTTPPCIFTRPKVNQGYVWGMTEARNRIWFGTIANPQCITQGGLSPEEGLIPYQTDTWVCEFGESPYVKLLGLLPAQIGDFRPPQIWLWDKTAKQLIDKTPRVPVTPENPLGIEPSLYGTRGIRAAASIGNLVLLAGPSLLGGITFYAYRADTEEYLGSGNYFGFDNIRQMLVYEGQLYIPVGRNLAPGQVLRWTGSWSGSGPCTAACFTFEQVGNLDGIGAYITPHQGRLYVTSWPTGIPNVLSGVHMSPTVPPGGLRAANASQWLKVWDAGNYEPDPVIANAYAGGAIASFDGYLYWGTMHVPWFSTAIWLGIYGNPTTDQAWTDALVNTYRSATIFRAQTFANGANDFQLLYGSPYLPAYKPASGSQPARWEVVPNAMPSSRRDPLYGLQGFGNFYNNYTWFMTVWDNRLWVGTMDWSHPAEQGTKTVFAFAGQPVPFDITTFFALQNFGADLYFFQSSASPAVPESNNGLGNYTSYGVRNLVGSGNLFVGMANPSNLATGLFGPRGGWELLELEKKPGSTPLSLLTGFSCQPKDLVGPGTALCTVTTSAPAAFPSQLTVGVLPIGLDVAVNVPITVNIASGATTAQFPISAGEVTKAQTLYLIAGLNGGTMVTSVQLNPGVPSLRGEVLAKGSLSPGVVFVDIKFTNNGTANAVNVNLTQVVARVLNGTGSVTYASGPGLSPALPANLGTIPYKGSTTVRLFFNVPSTVTRFAITEAGSMMSGSGKSYRLSLSQTITP
jgi:hypothetical protein